MDENLKTRRIAESEAGRKAAILKEGLEGVFQAVEEDILSAWRMASKPEDRDALWHRLKALDNLRAEINARIENGRVAEHKLNQ